MEQIPYEKLQSFVSFVGGPGNEVPRWVSRRGYATTGRWCNLPSSALSALDRRIHKGQPDLQINYQGVGSGAGIKQFTQNLVSFGASDAAMTDKEIAAVKQGVVLIPATAGSIVLAYNLPGVENLKLSREAYVGIFLGKYYEVERSRDRQGQRRGDSPEFRDHGV